MNQNHVPSFKHCQSQALGQWLCNAHFQEAEVGDSQVHGLQYGLQSEFEMRADNLKRTRHKIKTKMGPRDMFISRALS